MERLLTAPQAAELLGYSVAHIRRLCDQGVLKFHQNGKRGHLRFRRRWLDEYVDKEKAERPKPPRKVKSRGRVERAPGWDYLMSL
jgi:excisionase family DNA binding protein